MSVKGDRCGTGVLLRGGRARRIRHGWPLSPILKLFLKPVAACLYNEDRLICYLNFNKL
ncbi:protein of unknown function [Nitrospina watsonii]|uniref:Uncharacterized protein n=1 Tax=Nitrospina watsonii TaxID=1323948 RepID=A0ABM9H9R0_9BACT|nr:protein of unknown function [Nitrospina watsonii]